MIDSELAAELSLLLPAWGADQFGFGDLERVGEEIESAYGDVWQDYTRVISFAVTFALGGGGRAAYSSYSHLSGGL